MNEWVPVVYFLVFGGSVLLTYAYIVRQYRLMCEAMGLPSDFPNGEPGREGGQDP